MAWEGSTNPGVPAPLRNEILRRDKRCCYLCGRAGCRQVDHKVSRSAGGTDTPDNLAAICDPCHAHKSAMEGVAARGHGPSRRRPAEPHPGFIHNRA